MCSYIIHSAIKHSAKSVYKPKKCSQVLMRRLNRELKVKNSLTAVIIEQTTLMLLASCSTIGATRSEFVVVDLFRSLVKSFKVARQL